MKLVPAGRWRSAAIVVALCVVAALGSYGAVTMLRSTASPAVPSIRDSAGASATTAPGGVVTVTGHALYEPSETELMFSDGTGTYQVTMDISTRCVNLRGKLLGGYQFVSRIAMITSLPLTITGTRDGTTIRAETVLLPTTKDAIT